jgi:hypothetical protein
MLALRTLKGAGACASFPVTCTLEILLKLVVGVAGELDEASLLRGVRVLRVSTPGIVLSVLQYC